MPCHFLQSRDNGIMNDTSLDEKLARLHAIVWQLGRVVVAFSGGVDSSYLLSVATDLLGPENVLGVTVDSPLMRRSEIAVAEQVAGALGARHLVVRRDDLADPMVASNPVDRCYHCKFGRFTDLHQIAQEHGFEHLVHGENTDDADDYRPGARAAHRLNVRAPLAEAGLTKAEVRELSRRRGLITWNLPARACLASRFPYGTGLTAEGLGRVEAAETFLEERFGLRQLRVRDHYPIARLEVEPDNIARLAAPEAREQIVTRLRQLGYSYMALDLSGYRMGSLNEVDAVTRQDDCFLGLADS
jgi:uncharacterized protein